MVLGTWCWVSLNQATGDRRQATNYLAVMAFGMSYPAGFLTGVVQKKETLLAERQTKDAIFGDVLVLQR